MKKEIHINSRRQLRLFPSGDYGNHFETHGIVGEFYETIAQAFLGGKRKTRRVMEPGGIGFFCEPDIEDKEKERWIEVKSTKSSNYYKLYDTQIDKYRQLLKESSWNNPKIDFAFFAYNIKNVLKECPNEDALIRDLAEKTESMLMAPFSIVEKIWKNSRRFIGESYNHYSYFNNLDADLFINDAEKAFNKFDIDKRDYNLSKRIFPDNYTIEGFKINAFQIINIEHKL